MRIFFAEPYYTFYYNEDTGNFRAESNSPMKKGRRLKPWKQGGYLTIKLGEINRSVHQLIAQKLLGVHPGLVVNHKDGNKLNNSLKNLEYVTIEENIKHAVRMGLHVSSDPKRSGRYKDGRATKDRIKQYKHEWYLRRERGQNTSP